MSGNSPEAKSVLSSSQFSSPSNKKLKLFKPIRFSSSSGRWEAGVAEETRNLPDKFVTGDIRPLLDELVSEEIRPLRDELVSEETRILPDEVITEILEWLPLQSILRFRCVSKQWSALFRNPTFTRNHRLKQGRAKHGTMLLLSRRLPPPLSIHDMLSSDDMVEVLSFHDLNSPERKVRPSLHISEYLKRLVGDYPSESPCQRCGYELRLLGPINGIVCLAYGCQHYILCNPALREYKLLPPFLPDSPNADYYPHVVADGFGVSYPSSTSTRRFEEDFKIIVMHRFMRRNQTTLPLPLVYTHLYNRRTNSWRQLDNAPLIPAVHLNNVSSIFFNGACHWCGINYAWDRKMIMSFDMTSEKFLLMELPNCLQENAQDPQPLVLNNRLGVVHHKIWQDRELHSVVEMWVMKEYGVEDSWTRRFVISRQSLLTFFLPWKNDDSTLLVKKQVQTTRLIDKDFDGAKDQLTSIDLHTNEMRRFQVFADFSSLCCLIYEESLVSVN